MAALHPSRAQLARENCALRARLAKAERALAALRRAEARRVADSERARARERELGALHQLSAIALAAQPRSQMLQAAVQVIRDRTGFPIVAIEEYDAGRQLMTFAAATGLPADPAPLQIPVDQTLSGVVAQSGQPLVEPNAQARSEYAAAPLRRLGVRTFVCVPMIVKGQVLGTLALAHPERVALDAPFVTWVSSLANVIAVMIERARSERKLRTLFDLLPVGVSILDAEHRIAFVNPALEQILALPHEVLVQGGYRSRRYLRPDGSPMPAEEFASTRAIAEQRAIHDVETGIVKEDGQIVWVSVSAVPVTFPDWRVIVVTTDIAARKQAEQALRVSQQNLEALIENTDGSIWSVDTQYRLIVGNRLYHQNVSAALGRRLNPGECVLTHELPPAALDEWRAYYDRAIRSGPFSVEASTRFTAEPHTVEYRLSPLTTATGQIVGVTIFGRDITARKQAEQALHEALAEGTRANADLERQAHALQASEAHLRALLSEKEVLLKEIHHRVKNNLQVVISLLRLQSRQVTDAHATAALRDSRQRVEVMALVHELLYRTGDMAVIDADAYLQQLATRLTQIYALTPDRVTLSVDAAGIWLSLDQAVPCGLIVSELLTNSLKYAFPDKRIGVIGVALCATSPDMLTLTVWDTGVGLAASAGDAGPPSAWDDPRARPGAPAARHRRDHEWCGRLRHHHLPANR